MRNLSTIPACSTVGRARARTVRIVRLGRGIAGENGTGGYTRLIDARAASSMLGVPHTWLLAQARAGRIPHHRLGHYVRFNPDDLTGWLQQNRIEPDGSARGGGR